MNALESAGNTRGSSSPWRTHIGFSLQRNTLLNSSYVDRTGKDQRLINPLDADEKDSLFDLSRLYYSFSLNLNYSLTEKAKSFRYDFLKKTELFLNSAFSTPVTGYRSHFDPYTSLDYIHYALEDISVGLKMLVYTKTNFFSDFSISLVPYPVSKFSQESGLLTSFKGMISLLYFLKKETKWSLAVSSSHDLVYSQYAKEKRGGDEYLVNTPLSTSQQGHLIYQQNDKKYLPSRVRLSSAHYLGIDFAGIFNQDLTLSLAAFWKVKDRFSFHCSLSWKDRIHVYHPSKPSIKLRTDTDWFRRDKTVISFGGSYTY